MDHPPRCLDVGPGGFGADQGGATHRLLPVCRRPVPPISVGVSGICRVLCVYWEVIPPATIKTLLEVLVTQCSRDSSAAAIRAAVCDGLGYLLDNQLSHLVSG